MEFIWNATTGKYVVALNGVVWNNCTTDADCPGGAICAKNMTWAAYPNMCSCLFVVGQNGPDCNDISSLGYFFFVVNLLICIIAGVWALVGMYDLMRMLRWRRLKRDAVSTSLLFTIVALCSISVYGGATARYPFEHIKPDQSGSKDSHNYTNTVALALAFFFASLAMLNISLVWINIASNVDQVKRAKNHNIAHYRRFLIVYYIIFMGALIISIVLGNYVVAASVSIPGVIFVMISYIIGYFRMRKMLSLYVVSSDAIRSNVPPGGLSQGEESVQKIRDSLELIKMTTIGAAVLAIIYTIFMGMWAFVGGSSPTPDLAYISIISLCFAWLSVSIGVAVIMWYLHVTIQRKAKAIVVAMRS